MLTRTERRQALADAAELRRVIKADTFLSEWVTHGESAKRDFEAWAASLTEDEKEDAAYRAGFRTWRSFVSSADETDRAMRLFATDATFKKLWVALKQADAEGPFADWGPHSYGPHNGGTPMKILRAIEQWHQQPKFTQAELRRHHKAIGELAAKLAEMIGQVTPGGLYDPYRQFGFVRDADEARRVLDAFNTPKKLRARFATRRWNDVSRAATTLLKCAGITPVWALHRIAAAAQPAPVQDLLPRKVRAANAYRTYMIGEVAQAVMGMGSRGKLPVNDQLLADVVARLVNADCSADDVRKALAAWRAEDLERAADGIIPGVS